MRAGLRDLSTEWRGLRSERLRLSYRSMSMPARGALVKDRWDTVGHGPLFLNGGL